MVSIINVEKVEEQQEEVAEPQISTVSLSPSSGSTLSPYTRPSRNLTLRLLLIGDATAQLMASPCRWRSTSRKGNIYRLANRLRNKRPQRDLRGTCVNDAG